MKVRIPAWPTAMTAALGCLWVFGLNRNIFYLLFTLSCALIVIAIVRNRRLRAIVCFALVAAASITVAAPVPPVVNVKNVDGKAYRELTAGQQLEFRFPLTDIEARRRECGDLEGYIMIVGLNLGSLDIKVNGSESPNVLVRPVHERFVAWASLPAIAGDSIEVTLHAKDAVSIFQGPEVSERTAYPDAVYLLFKNRRCHVTYHARLASLP